MGIIARWNPEAKSGRKKSPAHVRESEEQKTSSTEGIDCPHRGPCKKEIDKAESERCHQSPDVTRTSQLELISIIFRGLMQAS